MLGYLLRRIGSSVVVVVGVLSVIFVVVRIVPGDPVRLILGPEAPQDQVDAAREAMGLDQPIPVQYISYLFGALQFDFGDSMRLGRPALDVFLERLPATAVLALAAIILMCALGITLGVIAALRPRGVVDRVVSVASLVGQSLPVFWVGIMLMFVFARELRWLPSGGYDGWTSLILPAIVLALPPLSLLTRLVRSGLLDTLGEPFILTARAKGASGSRIVWRHALRNAALPVITVVGLQAGHLLGGAVIVETVFSWPGIGRLLVDSIGARDYSVVQVCVAFIAIAFVVINLIVDLMYSVLDPRVRLTEGAQK